MGDKVSSKVNIELNWLGREYIRLEAVVSEAGELLSGQLSAIGSNRLLEEAVKFRGYFKGPIADLPLPTGNRPEEMALREVLLKLKNKWDYPYQSEEVCHCRAVSTKTVDLAICTGAHSLQTIRDRTSANTACGTCAGDIESILKRRLV